MQHSNDRYFDQLSVIAPKFPTDIDSNFVWYGTLGYNTSGGIRSSSITFERINVLYNAGAIYSRAASANAASEGEGAKKAYQYFQLAAGVFRYLVDEVLPEYHEQLPIGLDYNTVEALNALMLAQAQECFWLRAVGDSMKNQLIARLAIQVSDYYGTALEFARKSDVIRSEWLSLIECKRYHFEAAAQYRAALDCLDRGKYGEEVARLQQCVRACNMAVSVSKYVVPAVVESVKGLADKARSDLARAEKDNDLIYLMDVPTVLPPISRSNVSQANIPDEIAKPIDFIAKHNGPLFGELLPYAVYQASKVYTEKLVEYAQRNVAAEADALTRKLYEALEQLNLPGALDAVEKPLGIPATLMQYSVEVQDSGGVNHLAAYIGDISKLSQESKALYDKAAETLKVEADEDEYMRRKLGTDRWPRPQSAVAGQALYEKLENYRGYLQTASQGDATVRDQFESVQGMLQVLSSGRSAMEAYVPNAAAARWSPQVERAVGDLRQALSRARGVEQHRSQYVKQLLASVAKTELLPDIVRMFHDLQAADPYRKIEASTFEPVYTRALSRFDVDLAWIRQQTTEQTTLIESIKQRNEIFNELHETDAITKDRQSAIQCLEVAYFKFNTVKTNLEEGRLFYNQILGQLTKFVRDCDNFVFTRRKEGRELEQEATNAASVPVEANDSPHLASSEQAPTVAAPRAQSRVNLNLWTLDQGVKFQK